jgi:hypothetical protein
MNLQQGRPDSAHSANYTMESRRVERRHAPVTDPT